MELSFVEIIAVAVIAFLVLGPEELIRKSYQVGRLWAKLRTQVNNYRIMAEDEVLSRDILPKDVDLNKSVSESEPTSEKSEE